MSTIEIVKEAIVALKDRTGSSVPAMNKWIETEKKVSRFEPSIARSHFRVLRRNTAFLRQIGAPAQNGVEDISTHTWFHSLLSTSTSPQHTMLPMISKTSVIGWILPKKPEVTFLKHLYVNSRTKFVGGQDHDGSLFELPVFLPRTSSTSSHHPSPTPLSFLVFRFPSRSTF
jgi:hypothetical protein